MERLCIIVALFSALFAGSSGLAQPSDSETNAAFEAWQAVLSQAAGVLRGTEPSEHQLSVIEARLKTIIEAAVAVAADAGERRSIVQVQLDALGPPPEPEAPSDAPEIVALRDRLSRTFAQFDGLVKRARVEEAHAHEMLGRVSAHRQHQIEQRLRQRGPTPLAGETWSAAAKATMQLVAQLIRPDGEDRRIERWRVGWPWFWLGLVTLWAGLVFVWLRGHVLKGAVYKPSVAMPPYTRRVLVATARGTANGLLPASVMLGIGFALLQQTWLGGWQRWVLATSGAGAGLVVAVALVNAAFAPNHPAWRIVPVLSEACRPLARRLDAAAAVVALFFFLQLLTQPFQPLDPALHSVSSLLVAIVLAALLISLLQLSLWRRGPAERIGPLVRFGLVLRVFLAASMLAMPLLAVLGFANLTYQFAAALLATGLIVGVLLLVRTLLREVLDVVFGARQEISDVPQVALVSVPGRRHFVFAMMIDAALILAGLILGLIAWGLPPAILGYWLSLLTQEISIGEATISMTRVLNASVIFGAVVLIFRWLRQLLAQRVFPNTGLDRGVQHSLAAVTGYLGWVFASIGALAVLGVDLTDLALIAGGLSIGIGFGLQNIVGNFVAGLILLAERPIKVGDWVRVGEYEGYVKRIKVRSTEIQTFQRADVIVPNSDLISQPVVNWMHEDAYCRIEVRVGVAYDSDVDRVRDVLKGCLNEQPGIVSDPAPYVLYEDFGDSALIFEARGYIEDADRRLTATSDLRFAIHRALEAAGIVIPFPQRDLHVKGVERTLERVAAASSEQDQKDLLAPRMMPGP